MMDTMGAWLRGRASRGGSVMVFDWEKAARMIVDHDARSAAAGLESDWEYTGGSIFRDGKPVPDDETYVYLASTWATPEIEIGGERYDCWRWAKDSPGWHAETYWPPEALAILKCAGA